MEAYKYDIAISLCKEDVPYAKTLVKALNPKLNVFFYEDRQELLIGELGPEVFGDVFKHEARVVVILYRKAWGDSYYTELERAAILDRTARPDQGQSFIMVIGMEPAAVPGWYPSSRIYASPMKFTVEKLAEFIEFKVNERGGEIKQLTFEDKINIRKRQDQKKEDRINFLQSPDSNEIAHNELGSLEELVNKKIQFTQDVGLNVRFGRRPFNSKPSETNQSGKAFILLDRYTLHFTVGYPTVWNAPGSQAFTLGISITIDDEGTQLIPGYQSYIENDIIDNKEYKFNADDNKVGWSEMIEVADEETKDKILFNFQDHDPYDLGKIITTEELVDSWFQQLFDLIDSNEELN